MGYVITVRIVIMQVARGEVRSCIRHRARGEGVLVAHPALIPSMILLMMMVRLPMMLGMGLVFWAHSQGHIPLVRSPVHHDILSLAVIVIIYRVWVV